MNFINELRLLRRTIEMYNSIVGNCQVINLGLFRSFGTVGKCTGADLVRAQLVLYEPPTRLFFRKSPHFLASVFLTDKSVIPITFCLWLFFHLQYCIACYIGG